VAGDSLSRFLAAFAACAALDLNLAWLHAFLGHALGEGDLHSGRLGHRHGVATSPTGTVEFSASSIDAFPDPAACTLSGGSCQITYTAYGFAPSTQTITASYGGDSGHATSSGAQDIAVIPYTGPGPRPPILYCRVPNVTDQTLAQATRALRHFGCRPRQDRQSLQQTRQERPRNLTETRAREAPAGAREDPSRGQQR